MLSGDHVTAMDSRWQRLPQRKAGCTVVDLSPPLGPMGRHLPRSPRRLAVASIVFAACKHLGTPALSMVCLVPTPLPLPGLLPLPV